MITLTLSHDVQMPALGFGVFRTPPEETRAAVEAALTTGYRHVDTGRRGGPDPTGITLESFGRQIPEA